MRMGNKFLLGLLIPIFIMVVLFFYVPSINTGVAVCGDGFCSDDELLSCSIDCSRGCIESTKGISDVEGECSIGFADAYINLAQQGEIQREWLEGDEIIDVSNPKIVEIAQGLRRETVKDTVRAVAAWTVRNIRYDGENDYNDCKGVKSSEVINRGFGLCSTQSKVNIALLRANGIPAYSVTGCFKFNDACNVVQTFFSGKLPPFLEIFVDESGYAATKGFLHNWVIVPIWKDGVIEDVFLESTSGQLIENKCVNYREYYVAPPDSLACGLWQFDENLQDCLQW